MSGKARGLTFFGPRCMETASGLEFDIVEPSADKIDWHDIAVSLSNLCRFNGHTRVFYSVAEHSVLAWNIAKFNGCHGDLLRAVLLHDATEAYTGDLISPVKWVLRDKAPEVWEDLERGVDFAVASKAGIDPALFLNPIVKRCDLAALQLEARNLSTSRGRGWQPIEHELDVPQDWGRRLGLPPENAQFLFLAAMEEQGLI